MPAGYGDTDTRGRGGTAKSRSQGRGGPRRVPSLLEWIDPRMKDGNLLYTEGREFWDNSDISSGENSRRLNLLKGYEKEDAARAKIKPIKDPEGDKSESRRRAAKRKSKGRQGTILTTLSQGRETLG